jgi:hypothetical protein
MRRLPASLAALMTLGTLAACEPPDGAAPPNAVEASAAGRQSVLLTVGETPRQRFEGFGFSVPQNSYHAQLSEQNRAEVDRLLFDELDTRIIRLWYAPGRPWEVREQFQDTEVIDHALAHGVTELLLGPGHYIGDPQEHAATMAEDIRVMRDDYGIRITATGVVNEPNAEDWKIVPESDYLPLAIAMRRELDLRGLSDVTTIGPEFASADAAALRWLDMITDDPEALAATDALGTHSYNMAATPEFAERVLRNGLQYWMTEAGGPVQTGSAEHDYAFGASASARFLNDLNQGVDHWIWFVGLGAGDQDPYQKLVMCEGPCATTTRIYKNPAYHNVQLVSAAFPPGTVMRHVTSDLPRWQEMVWSYGPKPPLQAAAGLRPDGRFAFAVVNDTPGITAAPLTSWDPPTPYRVTFAVPELADLPSVDLDLCRNNAEVHAQCGETARLEAGRVTLDLASLELITLVTHAPVR